MPYYYEPPSEPPAQYYLDKYIGKYIECEECKEPAYWDRSRGEFYCKNCKEEVEYYDGIFSAYFKWGNDED